MFKGLHFGTQLTLLMSRPQNLIYDLDINQTVYSGLNCYVFVNKQFYNLQFAIDFFPKEIDNL